MSVNESLARNGRDFRKKLAFGQIAETQIARWILSRGGVVLPIYDVEIDSGKGPRVFSEDDEYVAPDLLVLSKNGNVSWIEAKHKSVFTWHRKTKRWVTGIDLHHYQDYQRVANKMPWPVWLLFLHRSEIPTTEDSSYNCPPRCPVGLFGETLNALSQCENHRHKNWGKHGMVYWAEQSLRRLASLDEVQNSP